MGSPLPTPVSTASSGRPVPGQALDLPATRALAALPQLPSSQGRDSAGFAAIRKAVPLDGSIAPGVPTCLAPAPTQVLSLRPSPREKKNPAAPQYETKPTATRKERSMAIPAGQRELAGQPGHSGGCLGGVRAKDRRSTLQGPLRCGGPLRLPWRPDSNGLSRGQPSSGPERILSCTSSTLGHGPRHPQPGSGRA